MGKVNPLYVIMCWLRKHITIAQVKVAYNTIIFPLFRGGIKILDLEAQPSTLLASWGNYASLEPWKISLKHRLDDLKQHYKGFWRH
jgi:hypothetical protein